MPAANEPLPRSNGVARFTSPFSFHETVQRVLDALSTHGIMVTSMRNKTNRLEELFVRLVESGRHAPGRERAA